MGRALRPPTAEIDYGLGILCWKNGHAEAARSLFRKLTGTPFEANVRRYLGPQSGGEACTA